MKTLILAFSIFSFFVGAAAHAGQIVDKFDCTIQIDPFDKEPGYTAQLKLSAVREQFTNGNMVFQAPGNQIEANIKTGSGLEIQLHYDYAFKRPIDNLNSWSLYRCFQGYAIYNGGEKVTWACPQRSVAVPQTNGTPQFDQYSEFDQPISIQDRDIGTFTCQLKETTQQ